MRYTVLLTLVLATLSVAHIVGQNPDQHDLAVLKLTGSDLVTLEFKSLDELAQRLGEAVGIEIQISEDLSGMPPLRGRFTSTRLDDIVKLVLKATGADCEVVGSKILRIMKKQIAP